MIQLYHAPSTASLIPRRLLREMDIPFELVLVDRRRMAYFNTGRWVAEGNDEGAAQIKMRAQEKVYAMLDQLDAELARHGGEWFTGNTFTALDHYVFII